MKRCDRMGRMAAVAALVSFAGLGQLSADVLIDETFEDDVVGNDPAGWSFTGNLEDSLVVAAGSSTGGTAPNAKVLSVTPAGSDGSGSRASFSQVFDTQTSGVLQASMKFQMNQTNLDTDYFLLAFGNGGVTSASAVGTAVRLVGNQTDTWIAVGGSSTNLTGPLVQGHWYEIDMTVDIVNGTFDVSVVDLDNPASTFSAADLEFLNAQPQLDRLAPVRGVSGSASEVVDLNVDDIRVSVIPEPGSFSLMALGGALIARRRKR